MSYYDNIKDSVQDDDGEGSSDGEANFDTLRKAAEETSDQHEGDDTEIEVLEEGLRSRSSSGKGQGQQEQQRQQTKQIRDKGQEPSRSSEKPAASQEVDSSAVEEKLDRIIEQNARMIEILESFGN